MASRRGGVDRLDTQTAAYFAEMAEHFAQLSDPEEAALLAGNALTEIKGKEAVAACDAKSSRFLEKLVDAADADAVLSFLAALIDGEHVDAMPPFIAIAVAPFGSHVAEHLLDSLAGIAAEADPQLRARVATVLGDLCALVADWNLYSVITSASGSHVARRLLCTVTGRDVTPATGRDAGKQKGGGKRVSGLAAKMGVRALPTSGAGPAFPGLAAKLAHTLLGEAYAEALPGELIYNAYAGPFLQTLLNACADDGETLVELIAAMLGAGPAEGGAGERLAALADVDLHAVMQERTSSHLMEVMLGVAPPALFAELWQRGFQGSLLELSLDGSANFVVQAALAALRESAQVKEALAELKDSFSELLSRRRTGVIAALLAASGRLKSAHVDACRALSRGLTALPAADVAKRGLAPVLLTLDGGARLGDAAVHAGPGGRLCPAGCAMLAVILSFPLDACQQFANSISSLPAADAARVGHDAGGVRVLEALLEGPASTKQKARLLRTLGGSWAGLAAEFGASHLVEKCYANAGLQEKEAIVQELANSRKLLYNAPRGSAVLRACGVDAYVRSPAEWRQRASSAAAARDQFSRLFGDDKEGGHAGTATHAAVHGDGDAENGAQDEGGPGTKPAGKGKGHSGGGAGVGGHAPDEVEAGKTAATKKKKKKRKGAEAAEARETDADVARARAAELGGQRTADVMQLLGFGNDGADAQQQPVKNAKKSAAATAGSGTPSAPAVAKALKPAAATATKPSAVKSVESADKAVQHAALNPATATPELVVSAKKRRRARTPEGLAPSPAPSPAPAHVATAEAGVNGVTKPGKKSKAAKPASRVGLQHEPDDNCALAHSAEVGEERMERKKKKDKQREMA